MEPRQFKLRVTYGKTGRLAMLSHLEITHALERMVRRANLPFALSNGFSPHMKIAFGSALPVGIGGAQEIFDLTLDDYVAPAKALEALQQAAPTDLMPTAAEYVESSAKAASVAYPASVYEVVFDGPIDGVSWPETIEVTRKGKQKTLLVDDYLVGKPVIEGDVLRFQLVSSNAGNLRPDVFVKALSFSDGAGLQPQSITRVSQSAQPL